MDEIILPEDVTRWDQSLGSVAGAIVDDEMARYVGPATTVVDLAGQTAVPGFIEGHGHFMGLGQSRMVIDLMDTTSFDQIVSLVAEAVKTAIERGEQALLFLNRRGFAPLTLCRSCGHRLACPNCDAWLVDHRFRRRLVCHHCGFAMPLPDRCPKCDAVESFAPVGPGVERLEQEAAELFPAK